VRMFRKVLKFFGIKLRPRTIEDLTVGDLQNDRVGIEQNMKLLNRQIDSIEGEKDALFQKGVRTTGDRKRLDIAQEIKTKDRQIRGKVNTLTFFHKSLEVVTGLLVIKENKDMITRYGISSVIARMDLGQLKNYVQEATIDGQLQWSKLSELVGVIDAGESVQEEHRMTDDDTLAIVRSMNEAADLPLKDLAASTRCRLVEQSL
jgi:hypothetical protein